MYPTLERPGYGAFVWQQAEQLRQFGHTVEVINIVGFHSKLPYPKAALKILQKTRRTAYDIVHAHYGLSAFPAWFRLHAPLIITLHGGDVLESKIQRYCSQVISHFADAVIIVSGEMQRRIPG